MDDRHKDEDKDKQRFVQQYVDRQRAYLPTYTAEHLFHQPQPERGATRGDDGFGFDTPVLRPRVPKDRAQSPPAGSSLKSPRVRRVKGGPRASSGGERSDPETQGPAPGKKPQKRSKRKEAPAPIDDTDDERTARLADRRERKRRKRAIVDPPEKREETITTSKKTKSNNQKVKKPAALALLYGFSATNVTKDRLTLKPAPALGVFNKGKASTKKKVRAVRKSSARNESFSEIAFLNKSSGRVASHSNTDCDSDTNLALERPIAQKVHKTKHAKKDRGKCTEDTPKMAQALAHATTESEVWDIELQSKLPSSVHDISSEPGTPSSAPVVLDVRGVEWSASLDLAGELEQTGSDKVRVLNVSASHSLPRQCRVNDSSPHVRVADTSSIHPSHSASQVGCRVTDAQPRPVVSSKYFTLSKHPSSSAQERTAHAPQLPISNNDLKPPNLRQRTPSYPLPVSAQELAMKAPRLSDSELNDIQPSHLRSQPAYFTEPEYDPVEAGLQSPRSNYDISALDVEAPDRGANHSVMELPTVCRVASSVDSLTSVPQPVVTFQTPYDAVGRELTSNSSPYDDYYGADILREQPGELDRGYLESVVSLERNLECPYQNDTLEYWYRPSAGLANYDVDIEDIYDDGDPLVPEYQASFDELVLDAGSLDEGDPGRELWFPMDEAGHEDGTIELDGYEEGPIEPGEAITDFLEGRALLLGVPVELEGRRQYVRTTALVQAEIDVANRLRDHWRPLRL